MTCAPSFQDATVPSGSSRKIAYSRIRWNASGASLRSAGRACESVTWAPLRAILVPLDRERIQRRATAPQPLFALERSDALFCRLVDGDRPVRAGERRIGVSCAETLPGPEVVAISSGSP